MSAKVLAWALGVGFSISWAAVDPAAAHDFGGSTVGGAAFADKPKPPPCGGTEEPDACQCAAKEGSDGGAATSATGGFKGGPGPGSPVPTSGTVAESDPVDAFTQRWQFTHTDLLVPGVYPIRMERRYDNQSTYDAPLGYGWSFSYDMRIIEYTDGSVVLRGPCGSRYRYLFSGGSYAAPNGYRATLTQSGGQFTVRYPSGRKAFFDVDGRMAALQDPQGNRLELSYDPRGKLPLTGTSPFALDASAPMTVAQAYRLTKVEERLASGALTGRFVSLAYSETTGRLGLIAASDGRSVVYTHEPHVPSGLTTGNLTQVIGLEGIVESFAYTDVDPGTGQPRDRHNVTSYTQGAGWTPWVLEYDASDRVTKQTHGLLEIAFGVLGFSDPVTRRFLTREVRTLNAQGQTILLNQPNYTLDFDADGYPTGVAENSLSGGVIAREFAVEPNTKNYFTATLKQGSTVERTTSYGYDVAGNRTSAAVALSPTETVTRSWTYDHDWVESAQVVSSAAPSKLFRTEYTFFRDGSGSPTNVQSVKRRRDDGGFETTTYTYNANGQLETITLPDGQVIRSDYYPAADANVGARGRLRKTFYEIGGVEDAHLRREYFYDAKGFLSQVKDGRGSSTFFETDALGRVTKRTNALGEETRTTYAGPSGTGAGELLTQIEVGRTVADGEGQVTKLVYNGEGRLTEIQRKNDAGSFVLFASFSYDSDGNRLTATDEGVGAGPRTTTYSYDARGLLSRVTPPGLAYVQFDYDPAGNRRQFQDQFFRLTQYAYDDLDRVTQVVAVAPTPDLVTAFEHDAAGNVTKVVDPKSQPTLYGYDALSRLTSVTQPLGQQLTYAWDGRRRLDLVVNARGNKLDYVYETWGPLKEIRHFATVSSPSPVRTVSFGYDAEVNLLSTGDDTLGGTLYTASFDALNRPDVLIEKYLPGSPDRTLDSDYDRFGNRKSLTLADGGQSLLHTWTFDKQDRLTTAALPGASGTGTQSLAFEYWPSDDLKKLTRTSGVTTELAYKPFGTIQDQFVKTGSGTQLDRLTYVYDGLANVTTAQDYDGTSFVGNHTYGYDEIYRLTSATHPGSIGLPGSEAFAYDAAGNREDPTNPALFDYDGNNRITASPGLTYTFDADGSIATQSDGGVFTHDFINRLRGYTKGATSATYDYDPFGRRTRKTVNGTATWFLWDGDDLLAEYNSAGTRTTRYAYAGGYAPVQLDQGGALYDVHSDRLDTPRLLTNSSQAKAWRQRLQAYGQAVIADNLAGPQVTMNFRFPGQYADAESGLYYNRFRSYDPSTGRYVSADPIGQLGGFHLFSYAVSNPPNRLDPLGLFNIVEGLARRFSGGGDVSIDFSEVDPGVSPSDFKGFNELVANTPPGGSTEVNLGQGVDIGEFDPGLGRVNLKLTGTITRPQCGGDATFTGEVTADPDDFDFNPEPDASVNPFSENFGGPRGPLKEAGTRAVDAVPGGTDFTVNVTGSRRINVKVP